MNSNLKIGLFAIGLDAYWEQFAGLEDRLKGYLQVVETKLKTTHPSVVNAGLVDNTDKAFAAGKLFKTEDVDVIFLYVTTYALSSTVLPVVQRSKLKNWVHCSIWKWLKCVENRLHKSTSICPAGCVLVFYGR
jgi:L-arabinose isomerase